MRSGSFPQVALIAVHRTGQFTLSVDDMMA